MFQKIAGTLVLAVIALATVVWVVWQSNQFNDGGPACGAICAASPAIVCLVLIGALWQQPGDKD